MNRRDVNIFGSTDNPGSEPLQAGEASPATPRVQACDRWDLAEWAAHGGPLPGTLADHIHRCPACAQRVRRLSEVHAALTLLRTQTAPANLLARSNGRGLRMLRRAARKSAAAARLLRMHPDLSPWQRAQLHLARVSMGAAAAIFLLVLRTGIMAGCEQSQATGQALVSNWQRHLDPNGEWFGPNRLA